MTISKKTLKKIASAAWSWCYDHSCFENYEVKIQGNKKVISSILSSLADEMNERWDNSDYTCGFDYDESKGVYEFYVLENDSKNACYEYDDDDSEEEKEIVADYAELVEEKDEAPKDEKWAEVRSVLMKAHDGEFWVSDHLCLALNYGQCKNEGRHPKTTDFEWELFKKMTYEYRGYCQEDCWILYSNLDEERLKLYWELQATSDNKSHN